MNRSFSKPWASSQRRAGELARGGGMARAQGANEGGGVATGASGRRVERLGQLAGEETGGGGENRRRRRCPCFSVNQGRKRKAVVVL